MLQLTKKQTEAFDIATSGKKNVIIYGGAIRGAKTIWLLATNSYLCSKYPKSRWVIVRKSLPDLERTTFVSLNWFLDQGLKNKVKKFNRQTNVLTFHNGSELIFMSENYDDDKELNRFRGLEANGVSFDEMNECQMVTFYKALERAGTWLGAVGNPPILVMGTLNPSKNWAKTEIYDKFVNGTLPPKWEYIVAKITDNPHIPAAYLQSLKDNMPSMQYQRFVEGDWEINEKPINPFAYEFDSQKSVKNIKYNPDLLVYISIDFNINPFCAGLAHHFSNGIAQFAELEIENGSIDLFCDKIRTFGIPRHMIRITGDAMGNRGDISQRDNATLYVQIQKKLMLHLAQLNLPGNPTHENSRTQCNSFFKQLNYYIDPSCKGTIRDLEQVQCNSLGEIIKSNRRNINERADHLDHVRYRINTYFRNKIIMFK